MRRLLIYLLVFVAWPLAAQGAKLTAELSAKTVEVGRGVVLTLRLEGGRADAPPETPAVDGLVLRLRSQSQQTQIANGKYTRAVVYSYIVGSNKAGEYTVPPIKVRVGDEEMATEEFTINVTAAPGRDEPEGMDEGEAEAPDEEKYGFLQFQLLTQNRKHVYPGEIAPVRVKAYFPSGLGVSLNSAPTPDGSAFTLHNLTKRPQQSAEIVDGKRYLVVTWYGGLSATKAGKHPASFLIEGTVTARDRSRRRTSPFNDPIFGGSIPDDFFAPMIPKEVVLQTEEVDDLEVRELPKEGRPADFSGAIGEFEFQSVSMPSQLKTGEPVQVTVQIQGKGNFALLKEPEPLPAEEWKVYEGQEQFVGGDLASFSGSKVFQYNVVPKVPGVREVELGFSYFDPEAGEYRSVRSAKQRLEVTGELMEESESEAEVTPPPIPVVDLAPLRTSLGGVKAYEPLSSQGWFFPVIGGCMALGLGASFGMWVKNWRANPQRAIERQKELVFTRAVGEAERAASKGDAVAFFVAARESLRLKVAEQRSIKAEAVTSADLEGREEGEIFEVMREADRLEYSGREAEGADLAKWNEKLKAGLAQLERSAS